jgi:hypothetical protein
MYWVLVPLFTSVKDRWVPGTLDLKAIDPAGVPNAVSPAVKIIASAS